MSNIKEYQPVPKPRATDIMESFVWPEVDDSQLHALCQRFTGQLQDMRDAISLDRQLLAAHSTIILESWNEQHKKTLEWLLTATYLDRQLLAAHSTVILESLNEQFKKTLEWVLTRGGTVEPQPPPAPTLAEAREAARLLAGEAAEVVTRYLEAQAEGQHE